jgi:hypothetical protein
MCIVFIQFICLIHHIQCITYVYNHVVYFMYFMNILQYVCIVLGHVQMFKHFSFYRFSSINHVY